MRFTYNRPVHPLSCVINSRIQFWLKVTVCVAHYRMARAELDSPGNSVVTKWASCLQVKTGGGAFLKCLLQFQYYYKQVLLFSVLFKERVIYTSVESSNSNSGTWVSSVRYWYRTKQVNRLTTWTVLIMLGVFFFFFCILWHWVVLPTFERHFRPLFTSDVSTVSDLLTCRRTSVPLTGVCIAVFGHWHTCTPSVL